MENNMINLGYLYGSGFPIIFYYSIETDEFYKKWKTGSALEKVIDGNEMKRLRMRLQNIMEVR